MAKSESYQSVVFKHLLKFKGQSETLAMAHRNVTVALPRKQMQHVRRKD